MQVSYKRISQLAKEEEEQEEYENELKRDATLSDEIKTTVTDNKVHIELKICTDEDWLTTQLSKYNGFAGSHGYYKFDNISQQPTPRISSATDLRKAVQQGDRKLFSEVAGISADTEIKINNRVLKFFDIVGEYLE